MLAVIEWGNLIVEPVTRMLNRIMAYLPVLIGALVILIVGWIIAKAIKRLVNWLLKTIRFDSLADKAGISEILRKGDLKISAREVVSGIVYWLIIIMVLVMAVDALGLPKASDVLVSLFAYVPNVIAALLVLVVAMFLASFVSGIVRTAAGNANLAIIERENLPQLAAETGAYLIGKLQELARYPIVGEVRGLGMAAAVELWRDPHNKTPFDSPGAAGRIVYETALKAGVIVRPSGDTR